MPKTNHNRNFVDEKDYTTPPGDHCRGKHGAAKDKRGGKKFRRSRLRVHQNQQIPLLMDEDVGLEKTKFDFVLKGRSKLRQTSNSGWMFCTECKKKTNYLVVIEPLVKECCKLCCPKSEVVNHGDII